MKNQPNDLSSKWDAKLFESNPDEFKIELTDGEISILENESKFVLSNQFTLKDIATGKYQSSTTEEKYLGLRDKLINGYGYILLSGLDPSKYSQEQLEVIYVLLGARVGKLLDQSRADTYVYDVYSNTQKNPLSNDNIEQVQALEFHTDRCDVVSLLMKRNSWNGGESRVVSSHAIHDEIQKHRPDLLEVLGKPIPYKRKDWEGDFEDPYYELPVFSWKGGFLSAWYNRYFLNDDENGLTSKQREAIDYLHKLCDDPRFAVAHKLELGDIQFINNFSIFHGRNSYEDRLMKESKRQMLRLWISMPNSKPLNDALKPIFGRTESGEVRGGFGTESKD